MNDNEKKREKKTEEKKVGKKENQKLNKLHTLEEDVKRNSSVMQCFILTPNALLHSTSFPV